MQPKKEEFLLRIKKLTNMLNFNKNGYSEESITFSDEPITKGKRTLVKIRYHAGKNPNKKTVGDFLAYVTDYGQVKKLITEGKYNQKTKASIKIQLPTVEQSEIAGLLAELNDEIGRAKSSKEKTTVSSMQINTDLNRFFALNKFFAFSEFEGELEPGITAGFVHCLDTAEKQRLSQAFKDMGIVEDKESGDEKSLVIFTPVVPIQITTPRVRHFVSIADVIKRAVWLIQNRLKIELVRGSEIVESTGFSNSSSPFRVNTENDLTEVKKLLRFYGFHIIKEDEAPLAFRLSFMPIVEIESKGTDVKVPTKSISEIARSCGFISNGAGVDPQTKTYVYNKAKVGKKARIGIGQAETPDKLRHQWLTEFKHAMQRDHYIIVESKRGAVFSFEFEIPKTTETSATISAISATSTTKKDPLKILRTNGYASQNASTPTRAKTAKYNPETGRIAITSQGFDKHEIQNQVDELKAIFINHGFEIQKGLRDMWKSFVVEFVGKPEVEVPAVEIDEESTITTEQKPQIQSSENVIADPVQQQSLLPNPQMTPEMVKALSVLFDLNLKTFVELLSEIAIVILPGHPLFEHLRENVGSTEAEVIEALANARLKSLHN